MAAAFCFFKLFFRLYFWLQEQFQQVIPGQALQNNPPNASQGEYSLTRNIWTVVTSGITAEIVAYPGHLS